MVENLRCVPRCASIFQRMKELIIDIFKYGWKHIGGTVLGLFILLIVGVVLRSYSSRIENPSPSVSEAASYTRDVYVCNSQ